MSITTVDKEKFFVGFDPAREGPSTTPDFQDNVNHPKHYNKGKIEVIEFLEDQKLNFHRANAVKYIARAGSKGVTDRTTDDGAAAKTIEDLKKAVWYLQREIHLMECRREGREPLRPNDMGRKG